MINKEYGSDFHYFNEVHTLKTSFFDENFSFFFSGRVALYNLLESGINKHGWKKVGFPSYYCHEVVDYCKKLPIEVEYYSYDPLSDRLSVWDDVIENVFINVDFFGVKKLNTNFLKNSIVIEDLTHNLLSIGKSESHYCFGSLRKQLPIATGGFVYSKDENFESPIDSNQFANNIALKKLSAMFLKSEYLKGLFSQKDVYRTMLSEAEENFKSYKTNAKLPEIILTQLLALSPENLISKTYRNIQNIKKLIFPSEKVRLLQASENTEMGLVFVCENNDIRNRFKSYLIENKIFPAILWPDQFNTSEIDLQNRILFLHADFRYESIDIEFIANVINKFIENV